MTETSHLVPPVPAVPGQQPATGNAARPAKTGVSPVTPVAPSDSDERSEVSHQAVEGTIWTVAELRAALSPEDLADIAAGDVDVETLRRFMRARDERRCLEQGEVPHHYRYVAHCQSCGPVWLWFPGKVFGCPWCHVRRNGGAVPRPAMQHQKPCSPEG